jgi:hypothetical protein
MRVLLSGLIIVPVVSACVAPVPMVGTLLAQVVAQHHQPGAQDEQAQNQPKAQDQQAQDQPKAQDQQDQGQNASHHTLPFL